MEDRVLGLMGARGLIVGGYWDREGGRRSMLIRSMRQNIPRVGGLGVNNESIEMTIANGGTLNELEEILHRIVPFLEVLIWMPNISNEHEKFLPMIKKLNPSLLLVSSKRVDGRDFTTKDFIGRMLQHKINLGIEISRDRSAHGPGWLKIIDPLGNLFYNGKKWDRMCEILGYRLEYLSRTVRMSSVETEPLFTKPEYVDDGFLDVVKDFGTKFSQFVDQVNPNRLLGNASTRCTYGFPSTRDQENPGRIFVSRRNVDKETLCAEDMVPVVLDGDENAGRVCYMGENKPSVDTPTQLLIYENFPWVNYIIHGHAYAEYNTDGGDIYSAIISRRRPIPCGDVREFSAILNTILPLIDKLGEQTWAKVTRNGIILNLTGHGCMILANRLKFFDRVKLRARPFPESFTIEDVL